MCTYSSETDGPLRHSPDDLPEDVVEAMIQSLLKEGTVISNAFGLLPCKKNPAPAVDDNFWKVKYDHEATKQARAAKRAERKAAKTGTSRKKRPSALDLLKLDDTSNEEEEDTGNSQAIDEEVTIISSDSEPLPKQKIQRVTRKVRFSHPLAYQDPQFLLKQQQFESRRQTRTSRM